MDNTNPTSDTVEVFNILRDAIAPRTLGGLTDLPDFMSYDECEAVALQHFADVHPDFEQKFANGPELKNFIVRCAAGIAWSCAAEATRRARGISRPKVADQFTDLT